MLPNPDYDAPILGQPISVTTPPTSLYRYYQIIPIVLKTIFLYNTIILQPIQVPNVDHHPLHLQDAVNPDPFISNLQFLQQRTPHPIVPVKNDCDLSISNNAPKLQKRSFH